MPVHSRIVDGQKHWWCEKCGPKGRWTNSHHTGQHDPNFSFNKKADNKKVKFQGQANLGEGLQPQHDLWFAEVRKPSCKPKNHFGQTLRKSRKQFGRRFNNVNAWMKKRKRHFNRLKSIKANAELPINSAKSKSPSQKGNNNGTQNASTVFVGLTIISGLTLLGISLDLGTNAVIESCKRIATTVWKQALQIEHCNLFQTACQITGLIAAPLLWAALLITSIKGETHLCQHFQVNSPTPRNVRRKEEQHTRKIVCANGQLREKFHNHRQH